MIWHFLIAFVNPNDFSKRFFINHKSDRIMIETKDIYLTAFIRLNKLSNHKIDEITQSLKRVIITNLLKNWHFAENI